jgi:hypothetical protein
MSTHSLHSPLGHLPHRLVTLLGSASRSLTKPAMSTAENEQTSDDGDHLREVPQGAGCTEIWEHLSDRREAEEADDGD